MAWRALTVVLVVCGALGAAGCASAPPKPEQPRRPFLPYQLAPQQPVARPELNLRKAQTLGETAKKEIVPAVRIDSEILVFALLFYLAYTIWWGYAIMYLFDGLGLQMKKAKKTEV